MRGVCFQGVEQVQLRDLPDPQLVSPTDAIVRVEMAGLCGSDLHPFFGREQGLDPGTVMGHEFVGKVVAVGEAVRAHRVGDRVFAPFTTNCGNCYFCLHQLPCRCVHSQLFGWRQNDRGLHGGQAELVRVPWADGTLKSMPPELSAIAALLLGDNFSTGYFAAELAGVDPAGIFGVIGCGTVGLLAIQAARLKGATRILAFDPVPNRRQMATELGAVALSPEDDVARTVAKATDGRGLDAVMELVGLPAAQKMAFDIVRPGGTLATIGCHCTEQFAFSPVAAYDKNLTYRTGRCPARYYMDLLTDRVIAEAIPLDHYVTHQFALEDADEAYRIFSNRENGCLKAVFVVD